MSCRAGLTPLTEFGKSLTKNHMVIQTGTKLFTVGFDSGSMAVKTEAKNKDTVFLNGMIKAKADNPKLFKKLEKL
jgi:hypothetical protein